MKLLISSHKKAVVQHYSMKQVRHEEQPQTFSALWLPSLLHHLVVAQQVSLMTHCLVHNWTDQTRPFQGFLMTLEAEVCLAIHKWTDRRRPLQVFLMTKIVGTFNHRWQHPTCHRPSPMQIVRGRWNQ